MHPEFHEQILTNRFMIFLSFGFNKYPDVCGKQTGILAVRYFLYRGRFLMDQKKQKYLVIEKII